MIKCLGDGGCLSSCECTCYNKLTEQYNDICSCGHRSHYGCCPTNCCTPVKCRNFLFCQRVHPEWVANCRDNLCITCAIKMGKHMLTNLSQDCPVCFEDKQMIVLECTHKICNECWFNICNKYFTDISVAESPSCPLCRNKNGWTNTSTSNNLKCENMN